eukprot:6177276-Pleurochrysis_carterae.AAC.2
MTSVEHLKLELLLLDCWCCCVLESWRQLEPRRTAKAEIRVMAVRLNYQLAESDHQGLLRQTRIPEEGNGHNASHY